jgi:aspartate aminotransferase-like enzyme
MTFGKNFLPGPTGVHPQVLEAMTVPMFAHYGPRMRPLLEEIQPPLQAMLGTRRPVFTVTCSGTGLMEAAIRNSVRRRVLVVVSGYFGEYFARIAERCGKEAVRVHVPLGKTLEADQLAAFLDGPPIDTVALVHSESSTGALAPLEDLARVVLEQRDVMLVVDGVSSAAGAPIEMDRIGVDFMLTGSQKALALPPGLAMGAVSERLERRAAELPDAGHYFSVVRWAAMARDYQLFETPALSLYFALQCQLRRIEATGGWPARWARHRSLAARLYEWVARKPAVRILAPEHRRTPTVSVLRPTAGQHPADIQRALDEQGFYVSLGLDPSHGPLLRIGHMGDVDLPHLDALLAALDPLL